MRLVAGRDLEIVLGKALILLVLLVGCPHKKKGNR